MIKFCVLAACLAFGMVASSYAKDKKAVLEELQIPDDAGPQGRAALEKFFGRELVFGQGPTAIKYMFQPGGRVRVYDNTRSDDGHFGDGGISEICLDFSEAQHDCYEMRQSGDKLILTDRKGGSFTGVAKPGKPKPALPKPDPELCVMFDDIVEAAIANDSISLVDMDREPEIYDERTGRYFWSHIRMGDRDCQVNEGFQSGLHCEIRLERDDPDAERKFENVVGQFQSCERKHISFAKLDVITWVKYPTMDSEDPAKVLMSGVVTSDIRDATIYLKNSPATAEFNLAERRKCKTENDCETYNAIWMWFFIPGI